MYKYNNINILLHLQRCDIVHRCNLIDLTALSHNTAASADPSEPLLPDATLGPQDMQKGRTSAVPGRESRRLHLALVSKKVVGTKFCISCEYLNKIVLPERSGQLSPVSGLIPLPQLQAVGPSPWVNLPAIQAHHQNIVEQLVQPGGQLY